MTRTSIGLLLLTLAAACSSPAQDAEAQLQVATIDECSPPPQLDSLQILSDLERLAHDSLQGRFMGSTGNLKARDFIAARFDAIGIGSMPFGRLQRIPVSSARLPGVTEAWNVVGIVEGTTVPDSLIVITAHFDHVGFGRAANGDSLYNGADDNASGTVALMALAKHFGMNPARHTLVFAAVDGEEVGMWGSRGLVASEALGSGRVVANLNMDMVSRNEAGELYAAGPGRYPSFVPIVAAAAECSSLKLLMGHDTEAAGPGNDWTNQSDHAAFHAAGIPFIYLGVEDHEDYHRPSDHFEGVMPPVLFGAIETAADLVVRLDRQ